MLIFCATSIYLSLVGVDRLMLTTVLRLLCGATCVTRHAQLNILEDIVGAKYCCMHALADGN